VPTFGNKGNGTAEALRRYGLVGTFAAGVHKKMARLKRFRRARAGGPLLSPYPYSNFQPLQSKVS
jgi:hypothetical protein